MYDDLESEHRLHDEVAYLKAELSQLHTALVKISEMDDYHMALVYDTLCDVGYYEGEDKDTDED